jgi:hypothetical protein
MVTEEALPSLLPLGDPGAPKSLVFSLLRDF